MRIGVWAAALAAGCGPSDLDIDHLESNLTAGERRARAEVIRDVARDRGLTNGVLLGGIGDAETGLAHCWSEARWACQGPGSPSCGGGAVIAGAGDGPCEQRQGGLGLFQFDGGTYEQTLARDGEEILLLEGNISHAVDFVLGMVRRSVYVDIETSEQALAWLNRIPVEPGHPDYEAWISTVTHYYNGCQPSFGCWNQRRARYESLTRGIFEEMGADFWMAPEPEPCAPIPPEGRIVEESESCYRDGGSPASWRTAEAGHGGRLRWTFAFEQPEPDNFAVWNLELAAAGDYLVEVYTDGGEYSQSKRARYTISHAGAVDEVVIDQSAARGFVALGELTFSAGGDQWVRLDDNTGEPLAEQIRIAFDAIRLTPVDDEPEEPLTGPAVGDLRSHRSARAGGDDELEPVIGDEESGCACVRPKQPVGYGWLGLMLAAAMISRSASSRRSAARRCASSMEPSGRSTTSK